MNKVRIVMKGGPGSGHWGHAGRKGKRGGSLPGATGPRGYLANARKVLRKVGYTHLEASQFAKYVDQYDLNYAASSDEWQAKQRANIEAWREGATTERLIQNLGGYRSVNQYHVDLEEDKYLAKRMEAYRKGIDRYVTVYHGTPEDYVESIKETGLRPGKPWLNRPPAVYFLSDKAEAVKLVGEFVSGKRVAIFEAKIPVGMFEKAVTDAHGNDDFEVMSAAYLQQGIPAKYLTAYTIYEHPGEYGWYGRHMEEVERVELKEQTISIYWIVMFEYEDSIKDSIEKEHEVDAMIAWMVPPELRAALAQPEGAFPPGSNVVPPEEYHITLHYLGNVGEFDIDEVVKALVSFSMLQEPVPIILKPEVERFEKVEDGTVDAVHVAIAGEPIQRFRAAMMSALAGKVREDTYPTYNPHITLAYVPTGAEAQPTLRKVQTTIDAIHLVLGKSVRTFPLTPVKGGALRVLRVILKGGPGSGHYGHAGRPGKRGGSVPSGAGMSRNTGKLAAKRKKLREVGFSHEQANLLLKYGANRRWGDQRLQYEAEYMTELNAPFDEVMESLVGYSGMEKYRADLEAQAAEQLRQERIAAGQSRDFPYANNAEELMAMAYDGKILIGQERKSLEEFSDSEWDDMTSYGANPAYDQGDERLGVIYEARGYHAKPELMSTEEFEKYVADNNVPELWRGTGPDYWGTKEGDEVAASQNFTRQFQQGDVHWPGKGVYGNGTYSIWGTPGTPEYSEAINEARQYATRSGSLGRMALRPDARIGNYDYVDNVARDVQSRVRNAINNLRTPLSTDDPQVIQDYVTRRNRLYRARDLFSDEGRVAALMGYDAVDTSNRQAGQPMFREGSIRYMVIYNRGALVMDSKVYSYDEAKAIEDANSPENPALW